MWAVVPLWLLLYVVINAATVTIRATRMQNAPTSAGFLRGFLWGNAARFGGLTPAMTNGYTDVVLIRHNECGGNGCRYTYNEMVFICLIRLKR